MFQFDQAALPRLTMGKALIVVDFQNDFIGADGGDLKVTEPQGFVDRTLKLVHAFRAKGDVVWVQSRFSKVRPVDPDQIIASDDASSPLLTPSRIRSRREARSAAELPPGLPDPEAFLSHEEPTCARPEHPGCEMPDFVKEAVTKGDLLLTKSHYSAFQESHLLRMLRGKMVMEVFICGSLSNIGVYATALDAACHGMTISLVEDCCGYRHKTRLANALKNLMELTGCDIASSTAVLKSIGAGRPAPATPIQGSASMESTPLSSSAANGDRSASGNAADAAAAAATVPDIVQSMMGLQIDSAHLQPASIPGPAPLEELETQSSMNDGSKVEGTCLTVSEPAGPQETSTAGTQDGLSESHPSTELKIESRPPDDKTSPPSTPRKDSSNAEGKGQSSAGSQSDGGPLLQKGLCEGDTDVIEDALPEPLAESAFELLQREVNWQRMSHQGGEVPRLVAVQGEIASDGSMPVYRHPADESPPLLPFSPTVLAIKSETEKHLGHRLNHVLIQFYRHGNDYISEHSDKTLDIVAGSFIANVSLGAQRTMVLRTKRVDKDPSWTEPLPSDFKRQIQRARLPHNSLFRMGLQTNMKWMHSIRQDKREDRDKSPAELAYSGGRISLTFRNIGTFLNRDETLIWGQGATGKTRDAAHPVINGQSPDAVKMLRAFGTENHSTNFDWEAQYGGGFDVLHITNSPRFFSSGDAIVNMRIALQLAKYGIKYAKGSMVTGVKVEDKGPGDWSLPEEVPVKFVDNDASKSVVRGEMAIMLYLDSCYGPARETSAAAQGHGETAIKFTRFQQGLGLSRAWRHIANRKAENGREFFKALNKELAIWDVYAAATDTSAEADKYFIAGQDLCLADFAAWPVLHAIREEVGPEAFDGLDNLGLYYHRVAALECAEKVLARPGTLSESK